MPTIPKWTTAQPPRQEGKGRGTHFPAYVWYAFKDGKKKDAAAEFLRVASLPETLVQWSTTIFSMVTRKSAAALPAWQTFLKNTPRLAPYSEALAYAKTYPPVAGWNDVVNGKGGVSDQLLAARTGKIAPVQALAEAARIGQEIIDKARTG